MTNAVIFTRVSLCEQEKVFIGISIPASERIL